MLNTVKILTNVRDVNSYDVVSTIEIRQGSAPIDFHIQLWQSDKGIRYIPAALVTVTVEFLRADVVGQVNTARTVTKTAVVVSGDTSMYKITLASPDVSNITTGGFRVTVVENIGTSLSPNLVTTVVWSEMTIRKLPSSEIGV
jgi:hypothetical protein